MSANVGLSTPRGSGTSGYVQRNAAHLRPRDQIHSYSKEPDLLQHKQRQPDKQILAHEKAREIEVQVFDLRDQLEEEELDEEEIETRCEALRQKLTKEGSGTSAPGRGLKKHQVHEMAAAKIEESDRLRRALGISRDYEEGSHWKKQEERLRDSVQRREDDQDRDTAPVRRDYRAHEDEDRDNMPRRRNDRVHEGEERDDRPRRRDYRRDSPSTSRSRSRSPRR